MDNKTNYSYRLMVRLWQLMERSRDLGPEYQREFFSDIFPKLLSVTELYDKLAKEGNFARSAASCVLRKDWKFTTADRTVSEAIFDMAMARPDKESIYG